MEYCGLSMPGLDNPGYHKISNYFGKFLGIFWKTKILVIDFDFQDFLPNTIPDFDIRDFDIRDFDLWDLVIQDFDIRVIDIRDRY